ncbi:MAG TPA: glycosyltransferase family 2 protein [Stellaceae bacterium]|nr:glycosyltransferase family 2 protein [Stellaceae bacterium]
MTGISFIVTVYNKRPFLPEVLAAVRGQRGDFAREYVIVDDGSTDGSLEFVRQATAGWDNCKIVAQENAGSSAAMNTAVAAAALPYLKLVDADDVLAPNATRRLYEALTGSGAVLAIGGGAAYELGQRFDWPGDDLPVACKPIRAPLKRMLHSNTLMNPTAMLLRRDDYLHVGGADEEVCCQDYSIALPLAQLGDFVYVPAVIACQPVSAPGRLTDNQARILHDVTMALGHFVERHPELAARDRAYAVQRAAVRALLWARRHGHAADALRYALLSGLARLHAVRDPARAILRCCHAFGYRPRPRTDGREARA